jgi:hypothetical protein
VYLFVLELCVFVSLYVWSVYMVQSEGGCCIG